MSWQVGLYVAAVLLPLAAFAVEILGIRLLGRLNAYIATGAIVAAFVLSLYGFVAYFGFSAEGVFSRHGPAAQAVPGHGEPAAGHAAVRKVPLAWKASVDWVSLGGGIGPSGKPLG